MKILYKPHTVIFFITPDDISQIDCGELIDKNDMECLNCEAILKKVRKQAAIELWARFELAPLRMYCEALSYSRESQMDFIGIEANWTRGGRGSVYREPTITVTYYVKAVIAIGSHDINLMKLKNPEKYDQYTVEDVDDD